MGKKLSIFDAGFLLMETRETPMHIGMLQLYGLPDDAQADYMEQVYRRMVEVEGICRPFNQKLHSRVPGRLDASWITDPNFDIDYHVRHSALPRPGRVRELLALVSRLHAQRLDPRRPLWETYLIEGLEGNRFAVYNKMHHSMMDGAGGMNLLQSRMATSPDDHFPPPWSSEWNTRLPHKRKKKRAGAGRVGEIPA